MLHYKVYQNKSKGNRAYGKWFARAIVNMIVSILTAIATTLGLTSCM